MSTPENKDLDVSYAARGVWLVKVPKYISTRWDKLRDTEVGRLRITKTPTSKSDIVFTLSDDVVNTSEPQETVPKEHQFVISNISKQSLAIFSQGGDKVAIEGHVTQKAECRPVANDMRYMQLKRQAISKSSQPVRCTKQIGHVVNVYKPVSDHKNNIEFEQQKKSEGKKSRENREKVLEMLFGAFEKHQYYNIKDLVRITNQPITYLKEILKDICNYNLKNPHKNMWELKPEYRHYKEEDLSKE